MRAVRNEKFESVAVAVGAKTADHRLRHVAEIGMFAKRFAGMRVRQMHFDEGNPYRCECVTQGNAGVGESSGIDQDEAGAIQARGLHALDKLVFGVGLKVFQLVSDLGGTLAEAAIDLFQRGAAIDTRLAFAEQVQIWTV